MDGYNGNNALLVDQKTYLVGPAYIIYDANQYFPVNSNQEYVLSFWVRGEGKIYCLLGDRESKNDNITSITNQGVKGTFYIPVKFKKDNWFQYWVKFSVGNTTSKDKKLIMRFYGPDNDQPNASFTISNIKLELGSEPTDWVYSRNDYLTMINKRTPKDDYDRYKESVNTNINYINSTIDSINKNIRNIIKDNNNVSLMEQTPNGWTFNLSSIQNKIEENLQKNQQTLNELNDYKNKTQNILDNLNAKTAYINISQDASGKPLIELGEKNRDFILRITNNTIDFLDKGNKVAYISNNNFYTKDINVLNSITIGKNRNFVFRLRENGNLGIE